MRAKRKSVVASSRKKAFVSFQDLFQSGFKSGWKFVRGSWRASSNVATSNTAPAQYPLVSVPMTSPNVTISIKNPGIGTGAALWVTDSGDWWGLVSSQVLSTGTGACGNFNAYNPCGGTNPYNPCGSTNPYNPCPNGSGNCIPTGGTCAGTGGNCNSTSGNCVGTGGNCVATPASGGNCAVTGGNCNQTGGTCNSNPSSGGNCISSGGNCNVAPQGYKGFTFAQGLYGFTFTQGFPGMYGLTPLQA